MNVADIFNTMTYGPAPESNSQVKSWLEQHQQGFGIFIDGEWVQGKETEYFTSTNPATGEVLAKITQSSTTDIDNAVAAARKAQPQWAALSGHQRAKHLYALARLLQKNARAFAVLESMDNGKPIRETRDIDIPLVIRHFYYHAGCAQLLDAPSGLDSDIHRYQPVGVVGQVIPWNFPLLMAAWKIAPALATGNCVVLKPAEYTSLTALMFAQLCEQAGIPAGVINIVTGDGRAGAHLVEHPGVNKVAFTGSTGVGRMIREHTAGSGKKITLELGGKSPFIVFDDADLDSAVEGLVDAIWFNQGQVCCAGSRLLVQENIADHLLEKIKQRMERLHVGDPLDKNTDIGAIVDPVQQKRISELVDRGVSEGATLWQPEVSCPSTGCFYPPTLLSDVETSNIVAREEIFGPVLTVLTFRTQAEAVALANNSRYGLAASIWSESISRAMDVAPQIKAGVIWVNSTNQFDAACGFGGYKESGFGREGGLEGLYEYLKPVVDTETPLAADQMSCVESRDGAATFFTPAIDQTAKHYIGGKQVRADNGLSIPVSDAKGTIIGQVCDGSRKDIRNAVEAAFKAQSWGSLTAHHRAQILFYLAENLDYRRDEFIGYLQNMTGVDQARAEQEFDLSVQRLFTYAAWADKYDGSVHQPPIRGVALAMNEPIGVVGVVCPQDFPLLALVSCVAPAIAMGNRTVVIPSRQHPLLATHFYQVLETSDVPAGVVNIVTGESHALAQVLADHSQVDGLWFHGDVEQCKDIEVRSAGNLKRTWVNYGTAIDWCSANDGEGRRFLREACQVKNIWVPYGD